MTIKRGIKGGIKTGTNGNGKYLKGAEAQERARKIYVLRYYADMTYAQIAEALDLTGERVRQILAKHIEPSLWLADMDRGEHGDFTRIAAR